MVYTMQTPKPSCKGLESALNSAAAAARRVLTTAARVTIERLRTCLAVKRYGIAVRLQAGAFCGRVVFDDVTWVYARAGPAATARIFCCHCLNHNFPLLN